MPNALAKALGRDISTYKVSVPWPNLANFIEPLRGNLVLVFGSPGVGKSAFSLNWALRAKETSCIISLDTDVTTQAVRTAGVLSGKPMDEIKSNPKAWTQYIEDRTKRMRVYDMGSTAKDVLGIIRAEEEFWGEAPGITVVDNVSNLVGEGGYEDYRRLFLELHRVARHGNTCVIALHHINRASALRAGQPLNLWSGSYSGEQEAELVLGLWRAGDDQSQMNCSVLKNRQGTADPNGSLFVKMKFSLDNGRVL